MNETTKLPELKNSLNFEHLKSLKKTTKEVLQEIKQGDRDITDDYLTFHRVIQIFELLQVQFLIL